jgi:hypothetical protein
VIYNNILDVRGIRLHMKCKIFLVCHAVIVIQELRRPAYFKIDTCAYIKGQSCKLNFANIIEKKLKTQGTRKVDNLIQM